MDRFLKLQTLLGVITLILLATGLWFVWNAPADFQQGGAVRILFVHVPSAKMALFAYLVLTLASVHHLWKKGEGADIIAEAAAPVGAAFAAVTLASGSIWGKPMWGTWWAWDARLTSVLVLFILYVGIIAMRSAMDDAVRAGRVTAILVIIGAVDLPIIHFSVQWWRTLHQPASLGGGGKPSITGPLLTPLVIMSIAFVAMGAYLLAVKARAVRDRRLLTALEVERELA
ncbi:MAG: cytochrome c biogenesis protein CcsA [Magnetococcales bacterium]|nr:cytochrome c biogenesis protein CcsA [Magnetococcales bacterium]MBF0157669.1 cytochrome c biogenesis protein CcsA [Magnetococcales bacterium]